MIPLPEYAKIKDNYCVAYMGHSKEYLVQLKLARPFIESELPGTKVYICCRDEYMYLLSGQERILPRSELQERRSGFAYVRELLCDMASNPVEQLLNESDIPYGEVASPEYGPGEAEVCRVFHFGQAPTRSLDGAELKRLMSYAERRFQGKLRIENGGRYAPGEWVLGVECEATWDAASNGLPVTIVRTGFGENMFSKMFPKCEIISVP